MIRELPIGVCGWCLDRHDVLRSIQVGAGELNLRTLQIGFFTAGSVHAADPAAIAAAARQAGVTLAGAFVAFEGEDYSSIARIAATGGLTPDERYPERLSVLRTALDLAAAIDIPCLALHAGTIPADSASSGYTTMLGRVREVADLAAKRNVQLLLETGRESAAALLDYLEALQRSNVAVSFDCGNFIVYGTDEPVAAASKLKGRIELVHVKDARRSAQPGQTFGPSVPVGTGDVQVARVVSKLRATGYQGPLLIETATREQGIEAVRHARDYLRSLVS